MPPGYDAHMSENPVHAMNRQVIEEFRANGGKTLTRFAGSELLLLHTIGARTGAARVNPMMFARDGERYIVFASKNAAPSDPDWYRNLVAHADVEVELGSERFAAKASVLEGEERQRVWAQSVKAFPFLEDHQARTARQIPVVALERV
jgi:deazaflavin-dependent oxidoreductase (nitroreductase family)